MRILGVSHLEPFTTYYHDTNIGFVENGEILFAALEERYSRVKHHAGFPAGALSALRRETGLSLASMDVIALPQRYFPEGVNGTALVTNARKADYPIDILTGPLKIRGDIWHCDHQLAHASVAFRLSPFQNALVVTLDGMGHDNGRPCFGAVFQAQDNSLKRVTTCWSEGNSLGLFYGLVTEALGWQSTDGEGKTMGLAAYGNPERLVDELLPYSPQVRDHQLVGGRAFAPQSVVVNCRHFVFDKAVDELKQLADRTSREDLAAAAQTIIEKVLVEWIGSLVETYPETTNICLGGGIFLNVVASSLLRRSFPDIEFFIPPSPADGGIGLGAALEAAAQAGEPCCTPATPQFLGSDYLSGFSDFGIPRTGHVVTKMNDVYDHIASLLADGEVIGMYQGRSEWGPRALGNRSVLAHPGIAGMRDRINNLLKKREPFMPFAPAVLADYLNEWFDGDSLSPYMMFTYAARESRAKEIAAVLHQDGTGRVQTVTPTDNPMLHGILEAFRRRTGLPMLLNTSFNLHGLPMVETPIDALQHLDWGGVDWLVLGDLLVSRR